MFKSIKHLLAVIFFLLGLNAVMSQELTQKVKGVVMDDASEYPLPGVVVMLVGKDTSYNTLTDQDGNYLFQAVIPGRYELKTQMLGYQGGLVQEVQVNTGKELSTNLFLSEEVQKLDEVVVKSQKNIGGVQNKFAMVSSRGFTVEETQKYPGTFEDPARMASVYSGVGSDPAGNNDIIVRGNSPRGVLWRIEGVEAPNPNHFGGNGATGGPISMIASSVLANSDFYTSAFPAEFGNATSGVFDIRFRKGNSEKREYSVDLNTLGARVSAEGPFKKGGKSSFLAHYRYSTLGLMNQIGIILADGGTPNYQDAAFKVFVPTGKAGYFTAFGLLGEGNMTIEEKPEENPDLTIYKGKTQYYSGIMGLNHHYFFDPNTSLKSSIAFTGIRNKTIENVLTSNQVDFAKVYEGTVDDMAVKFQLLLNKKLNSNHAIKTGVFIDHLMYGQDILGWNYVANTEKRLIDSHGNSQRSRGFVEWAHTPHPNWQFVYGLHYTYVHLNGSQAVDPRFGAKWNFTENQNLSFGLGVHSRNENLSTYLIEIPDQNGNLYQPNLDLGLSRSFHAVLGHEIYFNDHLRFKSELYYQNLFNVVVEDRAGSSYSLINSSEGFVDRPLALGGEGYNYGVEFTLEKFFSDQYFLLTTVSAFNSKYKAMDGKWRDTRYNTNYIANVLAGKEFDLSKNSKQRSLTVSSKALFSGGQHYVPIDLEKSQQLGRTVYKENRAYEYKFDPLTRIDLQVKLRTNRKKSTHEILLDIQNVTNNQTTVYYYYSDWDQKIKAGSQLQIVPMLGYKVTF